MATVGVTVRGKPQSAVFRATPFCAGKTSNTSLRALPCALDAGGRSEGLAGEEQTTSVKSS